MPEESMMRTIRTILFAFFLLCSSMFVAGQADAKDVPTPFAVRAEQLPQLFAGTVAAEAYFAKPFLAEVPAEQVAMIARQLVQQNGKLRGLANILPQNENSGEVALDYERAVVIVQLVAGAEPPNLVIGLLITAVKSRDDTASKIEADVRALPGQASLLVRRLDVKSPPLLDVNSSSQLAVGSTFKLWILAEASRQVRMGQKQWSSVIPLGAASLPSGIIQNWPPRSPMTLHSLATLMISISDNTASDTLLMNLGRARVGALLKTVGHSAPETTLPMLSTIEAFALKMLSNSDLRQVWQRGDYGQRNAMLMAAGSRLAMSSIDRAQLGNGPLYIDSVEWFASASDVARTLDWLRLNAGREPLDILSVSRPMPQNDINRFAYVGYKGGSEIGVISMSYLIQTKAGGWFAVSGSWNDKVSAVDNRRFEALINRAVTLLP